MKIDKETFVVYIQCHNYVKFHHICRNITFFHLSGQILCGVAGNAWRSPHKQNSIQLFSEIPHLLEKFLEQMWQCSFSSRTGLSNAIIIIVIIITPTVIIIIMIVEFQFKSNQFGSWGSGRAWAAPTTKCCLKLTHLYSVVIIIIVIVIIIIIVINKNVCIYQAPSPRSLWNRPRGSTHRVQGWKMVLWEYCLIRI